MKKKFWITLLKIVVSACLIGFLLQRIGLSHVVGQLQSIRIEWAIAALGIFSVSHVLGAWQWWMLLRAESIEMEYSKALSFYYVGLFFNNFLISNLGGDVFRMIDIRRYSSDGTSAVSTVFLDRFAGLFVLSGMTVLAAPWVLVQPDVGPLLHWPLAILIIGWVLVLMFLFSRRFAQPLVLLIRWALPEGITAKVRDVYYKIHGFGRRKELVWRIAGISLFVQSTRILMHYFMAKAVGVHLSPLYFFLFIPIVAIVASLPISLGGLGMREQTGVVLFGLVGVASLSAFAIEFSAYLIAIISSLPGGFVFISRRGVKQRLTENIQIEATKEWSDEIF